MRAIGMLNHLRVLLVMLVTAMCVSPARPDPVPAASIAAIDLKGQDLAAGTAIRRGAEELRPRLLMPLYSHNRRPAWLIRIGIRRLLAQRMQFARQVFDLLLPFLVWDAEPPSQREIAQKLGSSEAAVRVLVHRVRGKFRELLRGEVTKTVLSPEEVASELIWLQNVLGCK